MYMKSRVYNKTAYLGLNGVISHQSTTKLNKKLPKKLFFLAITDL